MVSPVERRAIASACAVLAAVLAGGCGGGSSTTGSTGSAATDRSPAGATATTTQTPTQTTQPASTTPARTATTQHAPEPAPTNAKVVISSAAVQHGVLPARYTCDGANISPPLHWKGIPPGTAELMLDVLNLEPVAGKLYFDWAVTGINPKSSSTAAGVVPPGAVVGAGSNGQTKYSLCPAKPGSHENYIAVLFALPHRLHAKTGFDATALRLQAERTAQFEGFLFFKYTRR